VVAAFFLPSDGAGDADRLELTNVEGRSAARCTSCGAVVITGDVLPGAFWRCPSCRELVSAELEECWNCGSKDTPSEP
jgi:predicted RNA-binding Zn-ribbon protein involved in translation (DUF1610 family)